MKTTTNNITIEEVNYFGNGNAKCLYRKNGKLQLARIYIDFFNRKVYMSNEQDSSCKVLKGFPEAINEYATQIDFYFN